MTFKGKKKEEEQPVKMPDFCCDDLENHVKKKEPEEKHVETCEKPRECKKKPDELPKRMKGESVKEYDLRVRQKKTAITFNKYMKQYQQSVKDNTAFHNSKYDSELLNDPEWSKFLNQTRAKEREKNGDVDGESVE